MKLQAIAPREKPAPTRTDRADGVRTADLMGPEGGTPVSTSQMGDAILAALDASL